MIEKIYDRTRAYEYARTWAFSRNPLFTDFTGIGGNCTNFVSQAIFAGGCVMNFTPVFGWYYRSSDDRTASWTGVEYLYNFLVGNLGEGPYARQVAAGDLQIGDVIQLGRENDGYYHTLLVVGFENNSYLVAAQSDDAFLRPLSTYDYDFARFLHIEGIRLDLPALTDCYDALLSGRAIAPQGEA
ncbi:MAG: amidase domain-containing protein [Clostridia bacterium]|nr:amidase domain-containing protein [Clostridia bacterium]